MSQWLISVLTQYSGVHHYPMAVMSYRITFITLKPAEEEIRLKSSGQQLIYEKELQILRRVVEAAALPCNYSKLVCYTDEPQITQKHYTSKSDGSHDTDDSSMPKEI